MACLDENTIAAHAEGRLPTPRRIDVERHVDVCAACAAVLADAVRSGGGSATRPSTEVLSGPPPRTVVLSPRAGDQIGRYVVLQPLGHGGMGTVLRAHDPDLDRDVAIKLLRRSAAELPDGAARLIREARSMALVTDPHVVQVFEVGVDHGRVYVAMELVEGEDLRAWLRTPRSVAEVLDVFLQAGRGLAAAHRAGLLHRDFKPDNVLLGRDARARVGDFGLAQLAHAPPSSEASGRSGTASMESSQRLTRTGTVLGTPMYMAPEQHANDVVDERADQFAFCAALYEALWHTRPYAGRSTDELARAKVTGPAPTPRSPRVPAAVRRAVLRGLAVDPADRHPDMAALLEALQRPQRSRRSTLALAGCTAAAVVLAASGWTREDPRCSDGARRLDGVWDASVRATVQDAWVDIDRPHTRETWQRVSATLDGWTASWIATHDRTCTAALAADDDELALDERMTCLEAARHELHALVDLLAVADDTLVLGAVRATNALPDPGRCLDDEQPDGAAPSPAVHEAFARVRALAHAGRYADAWVEAERLPEHPDVKADPALAAEAALWLGRMRHRVSAYETAEQALTDAYFEAQRAERADLAAEAAVALVGVIGEAHSDPADADPWARHAAAALAATGGTSPRTEAALHRGLGNLAMRAGDYERARIETEAGLERLVEALGPDHLDVGDFHNNLGNIAFVQARHDEAIELHEHLGGLVGAGGPLYFDWIVPAAIVVAAVAAIYLPFLRELPPRRRRWFVLAGALYVGGAVGVEVPLGWWTDHAGTDNAVYALIDWVEETLELAGATLFLLALAERWHERAEARP